MAGDITRYTFHTEKHYSGVRMQQGRVQMDADCNEQVDIRTHVERTTNLDVIGVCGAPLPATENFAIVVQGGNLLVKQGRIYVDGILCENEQDVLLALPPAGPPPEQPDLPGVLCSTTGVLSFETVLSNLGGGPDFPALPLTDGIYSAYLDVWERDITALDDPSIREIALGGPDTATRSKVVWQVKLLRLGDLGTTQNCPNDFSTFLSDDHLAARAQPDPGNNNPCAVPAQAGYRRLENQLYRVEIHIGGNSGTATFKWSRDNGSVIAGWNGQDLTDPNNLLVNTLGKDQVLGFSGGQWVELTDDTRELWGIPGTLVQLKSAQVTAQGPTLTIDPATASPPGPVNFADFPINPKIRRWDQIANPSALPPITLLGGAVPVQENTWLDLEDGVQVLFQSGGKYNTCDYWLIPARTATAISTPAVEWPQDTSTNPPTPVPLAPMGIRHHFCALALVQFNSPGTWTFLTDCRQLFPPLTGISQTGGCCCTVSVGPQDANNLQSIVDGLAATNPNSTVCLSPGTYTLPGPLTLDSRHSGLTIEGCHSGVILNANPNGLANFLQGLIVLNAVSNITLRGLQLQLPAVPFAASGGLLANIPLAIMQSINGLDLSHLLVGIGVRAMQCSGLSINACTFHFQVRDLLTIFEAGIFAGANCSGLVVRDNVFVHAASELSFNIEVRIGFLQAPAISKAVITQIVGTTASSVDAALLPAVLDQASLSGNTFSGLTAAAFIYAQIGSLRFDGNAVQDGYAGFELFTLRFFRGTTQLPVQFPGILSDVVFSMASAVAQGYPFPAGFDPVAAGQFDSGPQTWTAPVFGTAGTPADPTVFSAFLLDSLYAAAEFNDFVKIVAPLPRGLSLIATENHIDAVRQALQNDNSSGSGLVIWTEIQDRASSLVLSANQIRSAPPISPQFKPAVGSFFVASGSITGNVISNENAASEKISLAVGPLPTSNVGSPSTEVAVTGNMLRGFPILPARDDGSYPPPLNDWKVFNLILPS